MPPAAILIYVNRVLRSTCDQNTSILNSFSSIHERLPHLVGFVRLVAFVQPGVQPMPTGRAPPSSWALTWSDEFNGPDGSAPDPTKWIVESGGNGWGNSELQYYTSRREDVRQERVNLVIEAIKEKFAGPDGIERDYTSGRLKTEGRFSQRYGRLEARVKIPFGEGCGGRSGCSEAIFLAQDGRPAEKLTSRKVLATNRQQSTAACTVLDTREQAQ